MINVPMSQSAGFMVSGPVSGWAEQIGSL